jgi:hypothetical protein
LMDFGLEMQCMISKSLLPRFLASWGCVTE